MPWPAPRPVLKSEPGVEQILICSPDKDLAQWYPAAGSCVGTGGGSLLMRQAWWKSLAYPRHPSRIGWRWSAIGGRLPWHSGVGSQVNLHRAFPLRAPGGHPDDPQDWGPGAARGARLAESLAGQRAEALLYRRLATLREDVPLTEKLGDLEWQGATSGLTRSASGWAMSSSPSGFRAGGKADNHKSFRRSRPTFPGDYPTAQKWPGV